MNKLNVGDVIRFTEKAKDENLKDVTIGKLYVIAGRDWMGDVYFYDDANEEDYAAANEGYEGVMLQIVNPMK